MLNCYIVINSYKITTHTSFQEYETLNNPCDKIETFMIIEYMHYFNYVTLKRTPSIMMGFVFRRGV